MEPRVRPEGFTPMPAQFWVEMEPGLNISNTIHPMPESHRKVKKFIYLYFSIMTCAIVAHFNKLDADEKDARQIVL